MIELTKLATLFEDGLNDVYANAEIQFKIWAEAGEHMKSFRDGNTITHYINGNLRTNTSANDANALVMGINGLSLDFSVPVKRPRTHAGQPTEELARVQDGQYTFVTEIVNAINGYFQTAQSLMIPDKNGVDFTVAFQAGTCVTGNIDLASKLGNNVIISVYIEVYFIEGGINSKGVMVYFDGLTIPFMAARHGRTPVVDSDIYAGSLVSKNLVTSTAFAIDVDIPLNSDKFTGAVLDYLLSGEPNVAHFVKVEFGKDAQQLYLMTLNTVQTSAQGISIAGGSVSLMEVVENAQLLNIPEVYTLGRFKLDSAEAQEITYTASEECNIFIAGNAARVSGEQTVQVAPADIVYDDESETYYTYIISDGVITGTNYEEVPSGGN